MNKSSFLLSALKSRDAKEQARRKSVLENAADGSIAFAPRTSGYDFSQLPVHKQLRMMSAAAEFVGIQNPFFQVHDACAGATTSIGGRELINFATYNYLGLNGHSEVSDAACAAIARYGTTAGASRLVAGERAVHRMLEDHLARFLGTEDALAFVSGHATNVSVIGHLMSREDLVIYDAFSHNSILEGAKLSGASRLTFPHNDLDALRSLLLQHRSRHKNVLIAVEGLYSMDGDCPDMRTLIDLKQTWNSWLLVDEAHSVGVLGNTGRGIAEEQGIDPSEVEIWMGTLSKSLASTGGYIAGSRALIEILRAGAPGFVFSVGLPPSLAAAAEAALSILEREPNRVRRLRQNSSLFLSLARGMKLQVGNAINGSVIPLLIGDSLDAVVLSRMMFEAGFNVLPIIFPAVPQQQARLRFFVTSEHTGDQIEATVQALAKAQEAKSFLIA